MAVEDPQCFPRQLRNVFQVPGTPAHRQTRQRRRIDPLIGPAVPIARPPGRYSDPAVFFGCAETLSRYFDSVTCEEDNNCTENQSLFCGSPGAAPPTISMAAYAERFLFLNFLPLASHGRHASF